MMDGVLIIDDELLIDVFLICVVLFMVGVFLIDDELLIFEGIVLFCPWCMDGEFRIEEELLKDSLPTVAST